MEDPNFSSHLVLDASTKGRVHSHLSKILTKKISSFSKRLMSKAQTIYTIFLDTNAAYPSSLAHNQTH